MRAAESTYTTQYKGGKGTGKLESELKKNGWVPAPTRCGTCGNDLSFGTDGGGREISWCSVCQEGERPISRSSSNAMARGALVPSGGLVPALPTVRAGQLRCQRCAHGVEGTKRFCSKCTADGLEVAV